MFNVQVTCEARSFPSMLYLRSHVQSSAQEQRMVGITGLSQVVAAGWFVCRYVAVRLPIAHAAAPRWSC